MKTSYELRHLPKEYGRDAGDPSVAGSLARAVTAAGDKKTRGAKAPGPGDDRPTPSGLSVAARARARERVKQQFAEARQKFDAKTQPRDSAGKFRKVLARLKLNLGEDANEQLAKEIEEAEAAGALGNYRKAKEHGAEVVKLLDNVADGDLDKGTLNNIRKGSRELGKLLAYLPMPQGDPNAKVRFSDLPAPTSALVRDLVKRVEGKLDNEDAAKYVTTLKQFMSGTLTMDSDMMNAELARLLRVLA